MIRRSIRIGLLLALLTLVGSLVTVVPASADGWSNCPDDRLCLFTEADGEGELRTYTADQAVETYDSAADDKAVSVRNNTTRWACLYADAQYGGVTQAVKPGGQANLASLGTALQGKVSSHKTGRSKGHCWTGYERCPDGELCLFQSERGRGPMTTYTTDAAAYGAWDNRAVSVWNRTNKHVCLYRAADHTSSWTSGDTTYKAYVVLRGDSTTVPAPFVSTLSSHQLVTGTSEC